MYRQYRVRVTEVGQSLARDRSPLEDPLRITLDNHRTRLHRDVLDAGTLLAGGKGGTLLPEAAHEGSE
jgi:hypothetical protein